MKLSGKVKRVDYKKILYTTDLSESGRFAFPYAASIAHRFDANLTVLHVIEDEDFERFLVGYGSEEIWEEIKSRNFQEAKEMLVRRKHDDTAIRSIIDQYCQETMDECDDHPYVTYDIKIKNGNEVEGIVQEAHSGNYDLVVIGKHGKNPIADALMGNTARRVVRRCNVPVMVVKVPD